MEQMNGNKEHFQILLQQSNLTDDQYFPYFKNGEIEKLVIEKKARKWEFHFLLDSILPFQVFLPFYNTIKSNAFHEIATISFMIKTLNQEVNEKNIKDYWQYIIQQLMECLLHFYHC